MSETEKEKLQTAGDLAFYYNSNHVHCSQATMLALMDTYGIKNNELFRMAGTLAGGGGMQGDSGCGAYTAASLFLGLYFGFNLEDVENENPPLSNKGNFVNDLINELHNKFIERYGSVVCNQVHRKLFGRPFFLYDESEHDKLHDVSAANEGNPDFLRCRHVCRDNANWAVEILEKYRKKL